jgi:hypothetical protein
MENLSFFVYIFIFSNVLRYVVESSGVVVVKKNNSTHSLFSIRCDNLPGVKKHSEYYNRDLSWPVEDSKSGCKTLFAEWRRGWWRCSLCPSILSDNKTHQAQLGNFQSSDRVSSGMSLCDGKIEFSCY